MAVAKCRVCNATVTVRVAEGAITASAGESFRSRCKERGEGDSMDEPASCAAMRDAVARAALRAERAARPPKAAAPPTLAPA
ncbi:MAG TPA: hypothetical protein VN668_21100 [Stellaceae bacterium]|nr:hypothetical protein [Stellaceae bacterium]